eukprot:gnl/Dysnectes_brevis/2552_a3071_2629.p1 GENE.gnl/Dysnectes_brevis/2552_a3071_2629~~gnl/Dysnectes_brevis/2552_a3071_2629.p1  ORF type:complete len:214 (-),score=39.34 gnl/Dysnectes_brevis/2552_a3071_2629:69-710(-)
MADQAGTTAKKHLLKVIILGDSGCGKTSLMERFVSDKFTPQYKPTIGADFLTKELEIDGTKITMQIWDTAGQERFQSLGVTFYRGADACILVFDVTKQKTLIALDSWRDEFLIQAGPGDQDRFPFMVLGNMIDKEGRTVPRTRAESWCSTKGSSITYMETSAMRGDNVHEAFMEVARMALTQDSSSTNHYFLPESYLVNVEETPEQGGGDCKC